MKRYLSGQCRFPRLPEKMVSEFLSSSNWGAREHLPLKRQHFDIQAAILVDGKQMLGAQERLFKKFPLSRKYAEETERLLRAGFGSGEDRFKCTGHSWQP